MNRQDAKGTEGRREQSAGERPCQMGSEGSLRHTQFATTPCGTILLKLLKIGA
jgi:hypothetical protein